MEMQWSRLNQFTDAFRPSGRWNGRRRERAGHVRWVICAMLFFATRRTTWTARCWAFWRANCKRKVGWTEAQYGYIVSAFQAAYAVGMVFAGWFIDRVGTRVGYALMMLVWSLASAAHALVSTALGFGICRYFWASVKAEIFPPPSRPPPNGSRRKNAPLLPASSTPEPIWGSSRRR